MPLRNLQFAHEVPDELRDSLASLRTALAVPGDFPADVLAAADQAANSPRMLIADCTDIDFVTIDPPDSKDLDQALHIERNGDGFTVRYAIADVAAFITPGDPVDVEARNRGETLYAPDRRIPLHPPRLSEGAASLLPDQVRPAFVWTISVAADGDGTEVDVRRARVCSRAQLDYLGVQRRIEDGSASESLMLLREVGELRMKQEQLRGGVSLPIPSQQVVTGPDGWSLEYRGMLPVENWNAQISLLTGIGAAQLMLYGQVGILRTLPEPTSHTLRRLRNTAKALHQRWPSEQPYADFVRTLDPANPQQAAMLDACTELFRGAGYVAFDAAVPANPEHAAIRSEYAHVTAPLRRLVDRWGLEICAALCAEQPVPQWVKVSMNDVARLMSEADRKAHAYKRGIVDLVEAGVLRERVGQMFDAVVTELVDNDERSGVVVVRDPAVEGRVSSDRALPLGQQVTVRLVEADIEKRSIRFEIA